MNVLDVNNLTIISGGSAASLGAALLWSVSVSVYRVYGVGKSATWLNLFKGIIALICLSVTLLALPLHEDISARQFWLLSLSGVIGVMIGDSAFFAALSRIGGTLTSTIQCLAPSLTAVLAWMILGESLRAAQVFGLVLTSMCLAALLYFETKGSKSSDSGVATSRRALYKVGVGYALIAALSQAAGAIVARPVLTGMSPFVTSALRLWLPVLLLFAWDVRKSGAFLLSLRGLASGPGVIFLALGSFAGTFLGLTLMMYGMANAPLGVALALNSTYPIWILLGERLTGRSTLGRRASLFVVGSVAGIWLMI